MTPPRNGVEPQIKGLKQGGPRGRPRLARSVRPRAHREFLAWLDQNRVRFRVPIQVVRRNDKHIQLKLVGITEKIDVTLTRSSLWVSVEHRGMWFDGLQCFDLCKTRRIQDAGYFCVFEEGNKGTVFPSRTTIWRDHVFEPFLRWVNEGLACAHWLRLVACSGTTWANLLKEEDYTKSKTSLVVVRELTTEESNSWEVDNDSDCKIWIYPITQHHPVACLLARSEHEINDAESVDPVGQTP